MECRFLQVLAGVFLYFLFSSLAVAQGGLGGEEDIPTFPVGDIQARQNSLNLDVLDDGLVGDLIDLDTGSVSFTQMDVSIPGNSNLPVQFGRKLDRSILRTGMIGNWAPAIPYISRNYTTYNSQHFGRNPDRCSGEPYPVSEEISINGQATYLRAEAYFTGYKIEVPGENPGTLVEARGSNGAIYSDEFDSTGAYFVSTENWYVDCITPSEANIPSGGEGYRAHAPNGDTYEFTHLVESHVRDFDFGGATLPITAETLYVTEITDVNGNWVRFEYSGANLTRIHANDLREITFTYSNGRLASVNTPASANTVGRSWDYIYTNGHLSRVDLPDGRYWTFTSNGNDLVAVDPLISREICFKIPVPDIEIRHPSGTVVQFEFEAIQNGRKDVIFRQEEYPWVIAWFDFGSPETPPNQTIFDCTGDGDDRSKLPSSFWSIAVIEKRLVLAGGPTYTWLREYQEDAGSYDYPGFVTPWAPYDANLSDAKTRTVTDPEGHKTVTYVNRTFGQEEGQLIKVEVIPSGETIPMRTTDYDYQLGSYVGSSLGARDHGFSGADSRRVYQTESIISQDGDVYTTKSLFEDDPTHADFAYGRPKQTEVYSNATISTAPRITDITYVHDTTNWILGLTDVIERGSTGNMREIVDYEYNGLGQKISQTVHGELQATFTYHTVESAPFANDVGSLKSIADGLNRTTTYTNWKRGIPQTITRPIFYAGTTEKVLESKEVDDNGWVTKVWDALGHVERESDGTFVKHDTWNTGYEHDDMGRLTKIIQPYIWFGMDWSDTDITYSFTGGGAEQTIIKGNSKTVITYDSMFRPILTQTEALAIPGIGDEDAIPGWVSYVNTEYDGLGRATFISQPSSDQDWNQGIGTEYDALGRVKKTWETVDPSIETTYAYLIDHQTDITDPEGHTTSTWRYGYGGPITGSGGGGDVHRILQPGGINTITTRNIWGEVTEARQHGPGGDQSQYYYYNDERRLCRHRTPEGGDTIYGYDAAGQMKFYAKGQATGTDCPHIPGSNPAKVSQSYDLMGRPKLTTFHDGVTPRLFNIYNANGQKTVSIRGSGADAPRNYYAYDELGNLLYEDMLVDGWFYVVDYEYNADGHRTSIRYPTMREVKLRPDGLGRLTGAYEGANPTTGQNYVRNGRYYPSGGLETFDYGNGLGLTRSENNRLLTDSQEITGGGNILHLGYVYDKNGRVTAQNDLAIPARNRTFGYDGAGRLTTASGPWGADVGNGVTNTTASYSYDALGNITAKSIGSRNVGMSYDPSANRLTRTTDSGPWAGDASGMNSGTRDFTYDTRGNVTDIATVGGDTMSFTYDLSDQPVAVSGTHNGTTLDGTTYVYDGNMKRAKAEVDGENIYTLYSAEGALLFKDRRNHNGVRQDRTEYIQGPAGSVARVTLTGTTDEITFLHNDHLGSSSVATDDGGNELWTESYTPYGESLINASANDNQPGFTGHIKDKATGLNYMQARYYDPIGARFLSIDPVTFLDTGNPSQFNRYSYVSNNPINLIDPTGMVERNVERKYTETGSRLNKTATITVEAGNLTQKQTESFTSGLSDSFFSQNDGANFAGNATDVSFVDSKGSFKSSGADYDRTESARDKVNIAHQIGVGIRGNGRGGPQSPVGYSEKSSFGGRIINGRAVGGGYFMTSAALSGGIRQLISTSIHERLHVQYGHTSWDRYHRQISHQDIYKKTSRLLSPYDMNVYEVP